LVNGLRSPLRWCQGRSTSKKRQEQGLVEYNHPVIRRRLNARLKNQNCISVVGSSYLYVMVLCPSSHPEPNKSIRKSGLPGRSTIGALSHVLRVVMPTSLRRLWCRERSPPHELIQTALSIGIENPKRRIFETRGSVGCLKEQLMSTP
jgi:hypothetical protein